MIGLDLKAQKIQKSLNHFHGSLFNHQLEFD